MIKSTEDITINRLFRVHSPFRVPIYQRGYDWDNKRISELIEDISNLFNHNQRRIEPANNIRRMKHFFGGLVTVEKNVTHRLIRTELEIVDGQQRLTTWFITIWLLVDAYKSLGIAAQRAGDTELQNDAIAIASLYETQLLKYEDIEHGQKRQLWRLRLSKADQSFFERLLEGNVRANEKLGRDSHRKLRYAYKMIRENIIAQNATSDKWSIREKFERLKLLTDCILEDCFVVLIVSDDEGEAYRLFATLNDRGKPLSTGDLLRARTLELLEGHSELQDQVVQCWMDILRSKESVVDSFLNAYYTAETGERAPRRELYHKFREEFFNYNIVSPEMLKGEDAKRVEIRIQGLADLSPIFNNLSNGVWPEQSNDVSEWDRDRLYRLVNVLGHTLGLPLLLAICEIYNEKTLSEVINLIERFVFRYITIVGEHEGRLATIYGNHIRIIRSDSSQFSIHKFREDLQQLQDSYASDTLFRGNLAEKLRYQASSAQKKRIKHFLTSLEDHWAWLQSGGSGNPTPNRMGHFDLKSGAISIEHIYPQNPNHEMVNSDLEAVKHDLGNLSFWGPKDNSTASNKMFQDKIGAYKKSQVQMNRELSINPSWTRDLLNQRQRLLVEMGLKLFKV